MMYNAEVKNFEQYKRESDLEAEIWKDACKRIDAMKSTREYIKENRKVKRENKTIQNTVKASYLF